MHLYSTIHTLLGLIPESKSLIQAVIGASQGGALAQHYISASVMMAYCLFCELFQEI